MYRAILISVGAVLIGLALLLFSLNQHLVSITFPLFDFQPVPLNMMLIVCFAVGFIAGFSLIGWLALNCRRRTKKLKSQLAVADQEILHLRRNAIKD